jgi:hypothetical protein
MLERAKYNFCCDLSETVLQDTSTAHTGWMFRALIPQTNVAALECHLLQLPWSQMSAQLLRNYSNLKFFSFSDLIGTF